MSTIGERNVNCKVQENPQVTPEKSIYGRILERVEAQFDKDAPVYTEAISSEELGETEICDVRQSINIEERKCFTTGSEDVVTTTHYLEFPLGSVGEIFRFAIIDKHRISTNSSEVTYKLFQRVSESGLSGGGLIATATENNKPQWRADELSIAVRGVDVGSMLLLEKYLEQFSGVQSIFAYVDVPWGADIRITDLNQEEYDPETMGVEGK